MPNNVKITTIFNPLNLLAPHYCRGCERIGSPFCDCCKNYIIKHHQNFCPHCKTKNANGKCTKCCSLPPTFVIEKRKHIIGRLIHDLKYNSTRALATPLAEIIHQVIPEDNSNAIIVPLPTISRHIRARGLDHTKLIAQKLVRLRPNWQVKSLLIRQKNTVQVGADRKTRLAQAKEAYAINSKITIYPKSTYYLLDDVYTTGASLQAAIKKLQQAGVLKIKVILLAVS